MTLTPQSQAILLLTVNFGKADPGGVKPLSNSEWGRFATWLRDHNLGPADLLDGDLARLDGLIGADLSAERITLLLGRGAALGFALEKWERAGLWVLTRADLEYPDRLKRRLRALSPAVLFGCGNKALLNRGGLAVIGSRDASDEDLAFTRHLGRQTSAQGHSIVSGGARGVDEAAIAGALEGEGTGVEVLADSLLRSATSSRYRRSLLAGDMVLISPFNPEAGFSVGNAMARNKYIYCLADAAVVISSTPDKGGTWNGAVEALKQAWVPVWVKRGAALGSGNPVLVSKGAQWVPENLDSITSLFEASVSRGHEGHQPAADGNDGRNLHNVEEVVPHLAEQTDQALRKRDAVQPEPWSGRSADVYETFLSRLGGLTLEQAVTAAEIAADLKLKKAEVYELLKKGVDEGKVKKLFKPVRYELIAVSTKQPSLFGNDL